MGQIEDLRLFALVVENRSISRAADKLHIAKSAVSRRLNLLEDRFGARLIDRAPGVWEVTAIGQELYQRAVRVVGEVDEIEGDFTEAARYLAGPLTISVPRDFGVTYLKTALLEFKVRYPEIQLSVDFDDHYVDLARENYDFAIRITSKLEDSVVATKIGSVRHQVYGSPAYIAEHGQPDCPRDLGNHPLLNYGTAKRATWEFFGEKGKPTKHVFQPNLNSNSGIFLLEAAKKGLGLARLPDFIVESPAVPSDLVPVLQDWHMPVAGIYLVHSGNRRLNRRMRLFSEEIQFTCT